MKSYAPSKGTIVTQKKPRKKPNTKYKHKKESFIGVYLYLNSQTPLNNIICLKYFIYTLTSLDEIAYSIGSISITSDDI